MVAVTLAILGEPVIAILLAIPILGEQPGVGVAIGGPLIIAGVLVGLSRRAPDAAPQAAVALPGA